MTIFYTKMARFGSGVSESSQFRGNPA
jgi:hypothetical protein